MEVALTHVFGSSGSSGYRYDGKTDMQIIRELMREEGHSDAFIDRNMDASLARYLERLGHELDGERRPHRFPGVVELLDALEARHDRIAGLPTGNLEQGAHAKLRAAGIEPERFVINA